LTHTYIIEELRPRDNPCGRFLYSWHRGSCSGRRSRRREYRYVAPAL